MPKNRTSALLSLMFVFLSGALVGAVSHRLYMVNTVNGGGGPNAVQRPPKFDPEEVRRRRINEMRERVKLDDDIVDIRQWDVIRVPPPVMRNFEAGPDGLELLAFGAPLGDENDGEIVPGWWTD